MTNIQRNYFFISLFILCFEEGLTTVTQCKNEITTRSRHFIVTVPPVVGRSDFECEVYISSRQDGYALVTKHDGSVSLVTGNYSLFQGTTRTVALIGSTINQDNGRQTRALEIMSSTDITVYVAAYRPNIAAVFLVLPTQLAGQQYIVPTYKTVFSDDPNYLIITSRENATQVIVNNYITNNQIANVTVNRLESYLFKTSIDPVLAEIHSNQPVNVVVGSACTLVPPSTNGNCDTLYDSPIPVKFWGQAFIVPPTIPKSGCLVRLYPNSNNEVVTLYYSNSTFGKNISFQGMKELYLGTDPTVIISDQPIYVVQYGLTGGSEPSTYGDAFMTSLPAVTHYSNDFVFSTPFLDKGFIYRMTITIEIKHLGGLYLDGSAVSTLKQIGHWTAQPPLERFIVVSLELPQGNHVLQHHSSNVRFSALLYGYKHYFGFGFHLGFAFSIQEHMCENGGSCSSDGKCLCLPGYAGDRCETTLSAGDLTCFACDYTTSLSFCDSVQTCKPSEMCFVQRSKNAHGHFHYRSGCIDRQTCSQHHQNDAGMSSDTCLHCCDGNFCNSRGCGDNGFEPRNSRGPLCLDCAFASEPKECDRVTICNVNELCHIEELQWGSQSIFHLGCKSNHECAFDTRALTASVHAKRSDPLCKACCQEDFCNGNCTRNSNINPAIIG